ncbi:MAG TPA: PAS domain S-box protein, partial [Rugosimonospora sp.]|nr:PAS domain S-box protein [Rugosimonospora sp.]
ASTASALLLAGLTLALLDVDARRGYRPARVLAPAAALVAIVDLLGQVYGLVYLYGTPGGSAMTVPTSLALAVLSVGILAARPGRGLVRVFGSDGPGGAMVRRVVPSAAAVILVVGIVVAGVDRLTGPLDGLAVTVAATFLVVMLFLVLVQSGSRLDEAYQDQQDILRELGEQRDMSETILRSLAEGVIVTDAAGCVLQVSQRWCQILGYRPEQVLGHRPPYPWWPPDAVAEHDAEREQVLVATGIREFDAYLRRSDGTRIEVLVTAAPVRDARGAVRIVVASYRDLTERNRADAERRQMAEQLDHFFDMSNDLMCIAGQDGYFRRVNHAWQRVLGYPTAELLALPQAAFLHPDDVRSSVTEAAELAGGAGNTFSVVNRYRRRDGTYRWLSWNATRAPHEDVIYGVARDITAQREADEARARLVAIVDSTDDAIVGLALDGTIVSWNRAAERIYGYRAGEALGRSLEMLAPPELRAELAGHLDRVVRGESVTDHDSVRLCRDGTRAPVALTISPVRDAHRVIVGTATIARDTSDRKQVEEALAAARDNALATARLKSQFVAMVSHEIRTPMNGVIGMTNLLLDTPLRPNQRRYAQAIQTSARALLAIINDILDFSKVEAGKVNLVATDFDLGQLVEEVLQAAGEAARARHLEIVSYYPPELARPVRGDHVRLRQVLLNMSSNAVKFTREGEVVLRVEAAPPGPDGMPRYRFAVRDTGIGIAPEAVARLFEPFTQADSTIGREFGGTGLGLAISRQLVELLGGRLEVVSRPGQGSEFHFTVPLSPPAGPVPAPAARNLFAGRRLLVVEGNATARRMLVEHAGAWGMAATGVPDAGAGLAELRAASARGYPYQIAVLDDHVPGMTGGDHLSAGDAAVVLLSTADGDPGEVVEVLPKPVGPFALHGCLVRLLDPQAPTSGGAQRAGRERSRGLVLLAEDNDINQVVAVETLALLGYETDVAGNGLEAVRLAGMRRYQAILMDCQMPRMDGFEATRELRRREPPGTRVPIIAMTAGALQEDRQRCLDAGMDDYLAKPIDPDDLRTTLERWTAAPVRAPVRDSCRG